MRSCHTTIPTFAAALLLGCIYGHSSYAVEASGTTVAVVPDAAAAGNAGRRILKVQGPVFSGDVVETGSVGEVQIEFRDNTKLVVGASSKLTIDSFVFDENNTARKISMKAVKGAFRFISGVSRKQAYSIATPTATIGIRGTRFDFSVRPSGETSFALLEGEARLCDRAGDCMDVRGSCALVVIPRTGGIEAVESGPQKTQRLRSMFPFVVSQARLKPQFRVNSSACGIRNAALPPVREPVIRSAAKLTAQPPNPDGAPNPSSPRPDDPKPGANPDPKPDPGPNTNPNPDPEPKPGAKPNNPGNEKRVGNSGEKFKGPGTRGNSGNKNN